MPLESLVNAIGQRESSGNYNAIGKPNSKGQKAYGKYQVMDFNVPIWTKEILGKSMTPQEFLSDTNAQDSVAKKKLGESLQKYGNPEDAASVWFSGRPRSQAGNAADVLGTTTPQYVSDVAHLMKATPQNEAVAGAGNVQVQSPLVQKWRAKYPEYNDIPDAELEQKILAKYPQYADLASSQNTPTPTGRGFVTPPPMPESAASPFDVTPEAAPQETGLMGSIMGAIGGAAKSVASPVATMVARPFQAGAELLGAPSEAVDKFSSKYSGGLVAPVPQNLGDVKKDVGRGAETVALGLAPVAGGAIFGAGNSVEQGNNIFSGQTALQAGLGAAAGKFADVSAPYIAKGASAVTPRFIKDAVGAVGDKLSPATEGVSNFMKNTKILPDAASSAINKGASAANSFPGAIGNAIKGQYGLGASTRQDALDAVSKALGNTGKKSAGAFVNNDEYRLKGLETLFDDAPSISVTGDGGAKIAYEPQTATLPQHVEALDTLKSNLYSDLEKNLASATKSGVQVDVAPTVNDLKTIVNSKRPAAVRARAQQLIDEISKLQTPTEVNTYLQDLNSGLKGVVSGTSDNMARKIDYEATQKLNDALDNTILNTVDDSLPIRTLKDKYSSLKSVESGLVAKAQQMARKASGGLGGGINDYINIFNLADAFEILTNPVNAVKAGIRAAVGAKLGVNKNPENILQGIFKNIASYKGAPVVGEKTTGAIGNLLRNSAVGAGIKAGFPQN